MIEIYEEDEYISLGELARLTGVEYHTLWRWTKSRFNGANCRNPIRDVKRTKKLNWLVHHKNIERVREYIRVLTENREKI